MPSSVHHPCLGGKELCRLVSVGVRVRLPQTAAGRRPESRPSTGGRSLQTSPRLPPHRLLASACGAGPVAAPTSVGRTVRAGMRSAWGRAGSRHPCSPAARCVRGPCSTSPSRIGGSRRAVHGYVQDGYSSSQGDHETTNMGKVARSKKYTGVHRLRQSYSSTGTRDLWAAHRRVCRSRESLPNRSILLVHLAGPYCRRRGSSRGFLCGPSPLRPVAEAVEVRLGSQIDRGVKDGR